MSITTEHQPYEVLIRYNPDGSIRGAHRQRLLVVSQDGTPITTTLAPPEPLALSTQLSDALTAAEVGAPTE